MKPVGRIRWIETGPDGLTFEYDIDPQALAEALGYWCWWSWEEPCSASS